jgi:hypothetical protein
VEARERDDYIWAQSLEEVVLLSKFIPFDVVKYISNKNKVIKGRLAWQCWVLLTKVKLIYAY